MCLGVPGRVELVGDGSATVDVAGARREVCTLLLRDGVALGDWVLVHVGFAMARIDEDEARRTLELLEQALTPGGAAAGDAAPGAQGRSGPP